MDRIELGSGRRDYRAHDIIQPFWLKDDGDLTFGSRRLKAAKPPAKEAAIIPRKSNPGKIEQTLVGGVPRARPRRGDRGDRLVGSASALVSSARSTGRRVGGQLNLARPLAKSEI